MRHPKRFLLAAAFLALCGGGEAVRAYSDSVFPYIADGTISNLAYRTRFTLGLNGAVDLCFYDADGSPLAMTLVSDNPSFNGTNSVFHCDSCSGIVTCTTSGTAPLRTGWAWVKSQWPLKTASCEYNLNRTDISNPPPELALAVPPATPTTLAYLEAVLANDSPLPGQQTDLSFVLVNLNDGPVAIKISVPSIGIPPKQIVLWGKSQWAGYLRDFFSEYDLGTDFKNYLQLYSYDGSFCVLGVRNIVHPSRTVYTSLPVHDWVEYGHGSRFFEKEPDDDYATAGQVETLPAVVSGSLTWGTPNRDSYTFHLEAGKPFYAAFLRRIFGAESHLPVTIELWDDSYHIVAIGTNLPWNADDEVLTYTPAASGNYSLSVVCDETNIAIADEYLLCLQQPQ